MKLIRLFMFIYIVFCMQIIFAQNITVIGVGRLGISFALCLERAGYNVLGVDVSPEYVASINAKTLQSSEPHIMEYLRQEFRYAGFPYCTYCFQES